MHGTLSRKPHHLDALLNGASALAVAAACRCPMTGEACLQVVTEARRPTKRTRPLAHTTATADQRK